jgi:hypothetical protein
MAWVLRGLREGIVTTRYPKKADDYGASFKASVSDSGNRGTHRRGGHRSWAMHPLWPLCRGTTRPFRL